MITVQDINMLELYGLILDAPFVEKPINYQQFNKLKEENSYFNDDNLTFVIALDFMKTIEEGGGKDDLDWAIGNFFPYLEIGNITYRPMGIHEDGRVLVMVNVGRHHNHRKFPYSISVTPKNSKEEKVHAFANIKEAQAFIEENWEGPKRIQNGVYFDTQYDRYFLQGFDLKDVGILRPIYKKEDEFRETFLYMEFEFRKL